MEIQLGKAVSPPVKRLYLVYTRISLKNPELSSKLKSFHFAFYYLLLKKPERRDKKRLRDFGALVENLYFD